MKTKLMLFAMAASMAISATAGEGGWLKTDKTWTWRQTSVNNGAVWGNAGCSGGWSDAEQIDGAWWGCLPVDATEENTFADELQHSDTGALTGEEYTGASMVFKADGTLLKYDKDGNLLNEGTYTIDLTLDNSYARYGTLTTSEGAILWPFRINSGGYKPTEFDIAYLTDEVLILKDTEGNSPGSWGECTWWSFGSNDGVAVEVTNPNPVIDGVTYNYVESEGGAVAVSYDNSLSELVIPDTVFFEEIAYPVVVIGEEAFRYADKLEKITLPSTLKKIKRSAFADTGLKDIVIPEGVESVDGNAFNSCYNLKSAYLPTTIDLFTNQVFTNCPSLTEINVSEDHPSFVTIDGNLYSKDVSRLVAYAPGKTEFAIEPTCSELWIYACASTQAKSVVIPDQVNTIYDYAFAYSAVEEVTLPKEQPEGCFEMFFNSNLKKLVIPDAWTMIPSYICADAHELESVEYGDNVTVIGEHALTGTTVLRNFEFRPTLREIMVGFNYTGLEGKVEISEGVTRMGYNQYGEMDISFTVNPDMTELVLPSTLKNSFKMLAYPYFQGETLKIVNFSTYPISIADTYEEVLQGNSSDYSLEYYCLPGVGIYLDSPWSENFVNWTMDYCKEIVSFQDIVVEDNVCTFNVEASEGFEIDGVYYEGELLEPVTGSRSASQTYRIEGIGEDDLCNVQVDIRYDEKEVQSNITISSEGAVAGITTPLTENTSAMKVLASGRNIIISGAKAGLKATIYSASGVMMAQSHTLGTPTQTIAQSLTPGIYIVKVGSLTSKVVIR